MREAKKSLKEKGIKSEDVKNLPPIEELCKPIPRSSTIEVYSLQRFDDRDIPYSKPPDQCLDEFDNFIVKQDNFNKRVQNHLLENSRAINKLQDIVERTSNDVKMLVKHFQMVQTQIDQLTKVQKDLLVNASRENKRVKYALGVVLPLKILYILKDILRGLSRIISVLKVMVFLPRQGRSIK
jgi:hypothetical protein